jgi:hypothetical protein
MTEDALKERAQWEQHHAELERAVTRIGQLAGDLLTDMGTGHEAAQEREDSLREQLASAQATIENYRGWLQRRIEELDAVLAQIGREHRARMAAEALIRELLSLEGQTATALLSTPAFLDWQNRAAATLDATQQSHNPERDSGPERGS